MKKRIRTSIVWKLPEQDFISLIKNSQTMSQVLKFFGMENKGGNYKTCRERIKELNLDTSHFLSKNNSSNLTRKVTLESLQAKLIENSTISRSYLKEYLIKFNLLEYKCDCCKNTGEWQGKKLSLQLEHKNGVSNDNRLENLGFLCPNCHSQTNTFAGKNLKKYYFCKTCGNPCKGYSTKEECQKCASIKIRKYDRPAKEELEQLILIKSFRAIARDYGIKSDNAIRRWCEEYKINWVELSPFSRKNRQAKPKKIGRVFPSKYLYVSYEKGRNKWSVQIKDKNKKTIFFKRYNSELEAAQGVASYYNSNELITRKTNLAPVSPHGSNVEKG